MSKNQPNGVNMKFIINPGKNAPKKLKVRYHSQPEIVMLAGEEYQFASPQHYERYRERFESLVSEGVLVCTGRDYAVKKVKAPKPDPKAEAKKAQEKVDRAEAKKKAEHEKKEDEERLSAAEVRASLQPRTTPPKETEMTVSVDLSKKTVAELRQLVKEKEGKEPSKTAKKAELLAMLA